MTDRAARDVGHDFDRLSENGAAIVVFCADLGGQRVVDFFKTTS